MPYRKRRLDTKCSTWNVYRFEKCLRHRFVCFVFKDERGDDLWCRKQGAAALVLLVSVTRLLDANTLPPIEEPDIEKMIARAEENARQMLNKLAMKERR